VKLLLAEVQSWSLGEERLRHLPTDTSPRTAVEADYGHFPVVHGLQAQYDSQARCYIQWERLASTTAAVNMRWLLELIEDCPDFGGCPRRGTSWYLWSAIEDCHRQSGYTPLLAMRRGDFARYSRAVASMKGLPSLLMFPISVHHVKQMLELTALSPAQTRDVLMYVLGTVMCMRVNEVDQLKICDVLWRFDGSFHQRFRTRWRAASTRESRSRPGRECTRALGRQYSRASLRTLTTQDWRWRRTAPRVAR
jgi:hypothetical protein